jgi:hypothetical protein
MILLLGTALGLERWGKHFSLKHWHNSPLPYDINIPKKGGGGTLPINCRDSLKINNFFSDGFKKILGRWTKCFDNRGAYTEM